MKPRLKTVVPSTLAALLLAGWLAWEAAPEGRRMVRAGVDPAGTRGAGYESIGHIPRLYVAHATPDGRLFGIEDHFVFMSRDGGETFERLGRIPKVDASLVTLLKDRIARSKLLRRIRESPGPGNLVVLKSGTILVFWDRVFRSTDGGATFAPVLEVRRAGLHSPFGGSEGVAVGPDDTVYFGEYDASARPHPIRILQGTNDGTSWRVVHTFESGEIFHVHSIQYDPFRDRFWVCTGDHDEESSLLYTDDDFASLHRLGGGSQNWRIVSLMITPDHLFWGSDDDRTGAGIFRWDFRLEQLSKLGELGKVSYYSTILRDGTLVLSTTYEPDSEFTENYGPAPTTDLWVSRDGDAWRKILSLPHELRDTADGPTRAFIAFPGGAPLENLFFTPTNTATDGFTTQVIRLH